MGKLFDRIDCAWEMAQIDKAEQEATAQLTGLQVTQLDGNRRRPWGAGSKPIGTHSEWDKLRLRSRMKLLRTGTLMRDARFAKAQIAACPKCSEDANGNRKCCTEHRRFSIVFKRLKWAGEENMATRLAQGRVWGEDAPEAEDRSLNHWEQWYFQDKKEGIWPGTVAWTGTSDDVRKLREEYGGLDYRAWLNMLVDNEEINHAEYSAEKERLNAVNCA